MKKFLVVPTVLVCFGFICTSAANAENPKNSPCYTLASLRGFYAVVGEYGSHIAISLGRRYFDGNGNLTQTFIVNEPTPGSTTGDRTIVNATQEGTYTVNCDGTGVISRNLTTSNGITAHGEDDFVITAAVLRGDELIATTVVDAQKTPSAIVPGGIFLTRTYTRLPDRVVSPTP